MNGQNRLHLIFANCRIIIIKEWNLRDFHRLENCLHLYANRKLAAFKTDKQAWGICWAEYLQISVIYLFWGTEKIDEGNRQHYGPSVWTKNAASRSERVIQLPLIIKSMASINLLNAITLLSWPYIAGNN